MRSALEGEFERRVENVAAAIASQVSPDDIADVALFGEDGTGYGNLFVLLEELRATTRVANASVLDTARTVLYDGRGPEFQWEMSRLDTLAGLALDRALGGESVVSPAYRAGGPPLRAAFAPVRRGTRVIAVVAVEADVDYLPDLQGFQRTMFVTSAIIAITIAVLAMLFVRVTRSSAQLERRLSRAENLAAMGRLTATLAHEIKNPLAIIRGSAARLGRVDPEAKRMADYVVEESDRLSRTVARYLQFARGAESALERGDLLAGASGDARLALDQTLGLLEGELIARKVEVVRDDQPTANAGVALDVESLKQIYLNLMLNALDAMPEGGRLSVALGEQRGALEVTITDTGAGISPEVLKRLGQPFHTTKAMGSGLGLFLTRRLAESAGGTLRIESEVGHGTRCTVRLPQTRSAS